MNISDAAREAVYPICDTCNVSTYKNRDAIEGAVQTAIDSATAELRRELEEATRKREHTQQWYAQRWDRLKQWAKNEIPEELSEQFFNIVANGTKDVWEAPPDHVLQFNLLLHERDSLKREVEELRGKLRRAEATIDELNQNWIDENI
jgi:hypothetical protein